MNVSTSDMQKYKVILHTNTKVKYKYIILKYFCNWCIWFMCFVPDSIHTLLKYCSYIQILKQRYCTHIFICIQILEYLRSVLEYFSESSTCLELCSVLIYIVYISSARVFTLEQRPSWLLFTADSSGQALWRKPLRAVEDRVLCWMKPPLVVAAAGNVPGLSAARLRSRSSRGLRDMMEVCGRSRAAGSGAEDAGQRRVWGGLMCESLPVTGAHMREEDEWRTRLLLLCSLEVSKHLIGALLPPSGEECGSEWIFT